MEKKKNLTENIHGKGDIDIDKCNKISYAEAKRRRDRETERTISLNIQSKK